LLQIHLFVGGQGPAEESKGDTSFQADGDRDQLAEPGGDQSGAGAPGGQDKFY
jgi:hypothetical protein